MEAVGAAQAWLNLTRDSVWWLVGQLVGLACLVAAGVIDPQSYGLNEKQAHVVMVVCATIAIMSGKMANSPLPGKPKN